ncbi:MAG: Cation-independent mannose-6-phosphate receptor CI-MPR [Thelocarpon superellum]|nr:MAG: Cation-independent mannose-6-phosphate receptor CI-MPR [Thelocarpon superellum]
MYLQPSNVALLACLVPGLLVAAAEDKKTPSKPKPAPCTLHSPNTGSFFDITPISLVAPKPGTKAHKDQRTESWQARGYDYPTNFTLNICAPVLEEVKNVVGIEKDRWRNVSAYYELKGKTYSIGQQSSEPVFRGRKLVLNYTDGSPCTASSQSKQARSSTFGGDDDDDDDDETEGKKKGSKEKEKEQTRTKSTLISLLCERDPLAPDAAVSFVGASPDECAYFFELRSHAACAGVSEAQQTLGPGGVFGVIALIAILVYLIGGCVYQRTVMHARGWRQLPNYRMWAGMASFVRDMFIILTSSCARLIPHSRGYRSLASSTPNGATHGSRGTGARSDDENRLIDQLDEEWDD